LAGIGAGAAYIFFAYIGFDAVSTTAQEAKNPQRDLPIGMIASLLRLHGLVHRVAGVLTGMVPGSKSTSKRPSRARFWTAG
jgi:basic amino acid/polyamine antiporter, APA family